MKKLVTLLIMMVAVISMWAQAAERDKFRFDIDHQIERPDLQIPLMRCESNPAGGFIKDGQAPDKIIRKAVRAQAATQDAGTHLGYVTKDKLRYAIFQFSGSPSPVATLIGWADSYDYYPNIVVPDNVTYNGKSVPVTAVNDYAFINGWGITGLTLGKNVAFIGVQAFAGCNINDLSISVGVCQIMPLAFQNCTLKTISFEDSASTENPLVIGWDAFYGTNFKTIEIPARLRVDENNSFQSYMNNPFGCNLALETITINPHFNDINRNYTLEINQGALCARARTDAIDAEYLHIIAYPAAHSIDEFSIAADFIAVFENAFADCKINKLALNATLDVREGKINMNIGNYAFYYSEISSLNLSAKGPIRLGGSFTDGCRFLNKYGLSEGISNYKVDDGVIYAKKDEERYLVAYPCGRTDVSFVIPSDVMHLAAGSFNSNPYIKEVTLPSGLKTIGDEAFRNCPNLERLIFTGNNLVSMGRNALDYTKVIASAPLGAVTLGNWLIGYSGNVPSNLVIPETITNASAGIFSNNSNITSVTFPQNFENIPDGMFQYCYNLKTVQFPNNLKTVGARAFYYAGIYAQQPSSRSSEVRTLRIPEGVTEIGLGAFCNSRLGDKLILPSSLTLLGDYSLAGGFSEVEIHRSTPPDNEDNVYAIFSTDMLENSTLIIPKDADPLAFTQNPYWNFSKVVNGDFASVEDVEIIQGKINISSGTISSADGENFTLYAADGHLVGYSNSFSALAPGLYIVRLGSAVLKYIVR